ncbi:sulfatase-like hydrolase/transferase [Flammeovirga yaeyamensis]|uniref:Sulfatase-like hydrolase/transferase n=1 Tax=Flammeovirga yaeyamensis TaxID=367791 RepID=A0AAX1ND19_9BACT|nr:sulfatase [Flammeovirga yaeyamensis]MBB3696601.1 putative sulfatase [Flammeovirga yaeyamensis]NMF33277.1 sulfatase [Flammeovirga yaeyamensis]QWG05444.1 sulfatase-like hydrolase/transferase [Flammeovirga yaeyamensis]
MKYLLLSIFSLLIGFAKCNSAFAQKKNKPNLILIITDEHNFRTIGAYKDIIKKKGLEEMANPWGEIPNFSTPHINRIGNEGAVLTSMYSTTPSCAPSRSSMFTGNYPQTTGVTKNGKGIKKEANTIAKVLNKEGYSTGYIGKWHLDHEDQKPGWQPNPEYHGFTDYKYMFNRGHWKILGMDGDTPVVPIESGSKGAKEADEKSYTTDWLTDRTIEFIDKNQKEPFMCVLSLPDPHTPNVVRKPYSKMYKVEDVKLPETYSTTALRNEDYPGWVTKKQRFKVGYDSTKLLKHITQYHGMVKCIDDNMGKILQKLENLNLLDNTIVVFTSDHGDMLGELGHENKGTPYESSAKIPFLIRYPKEIKEKTIVDNAFNTADWMDTFLALMNVDKKNFDPNSTEGIDFSDLLKNGDRSKYDNVTFVRMDSWIAAITDRYKLVYDGQGTKPWFFDLEKDPTESINFFDEKEYKTIISELSSKLLDYGTRTNDDLVNGKKINPQIQSNIQ